LYQSQAAAGSQWMVAAGRRAIAMVRCGLSRVNQNNIYFPPY